MARPKKSDKRPQDPTNVDISKLDEALEKDIAKASGFLDDEDDDVVVEDNNEILNNSGDNIVNSEPVNHGYEMPPSNNPIDDDYNDDIPKIDADFIPESDGNPLEDKKIKRPYTVEENISNNTSDDAPKAEPIIPEPIIKAQEISDINVGREENIETNTSPSSQPKQPSEPKRPTINQNLEDLSPSQKKKAAEQSADALLLAYGNIVPIPFKKISSFNLGKLDNLHLKGEIDKDMVISDDGTTIKSYCEGVNQQVEQTFEITQEMKDEIRQPLIEVLLENNFALTPTQRLLMAVGGQIVTMGLTSFQFMQQNKAAMNQFKVFHKETKEAIAASKVKEPVIIHQEVREQPATQYRTEKAKPVEVYETIVPEPEYKTETTKKVEDYIQGNSSGITVETVPNED